MRQFWRLSDHDETNKYDLLRFNYRERLSLPFATSMARAIGGDGAFDLHGIARSPMNTGRVLIANRLVDGSRAVSEADMLKVRDAVLGKTKTTALRKLWRRDVMEKVISNSENRFTWARAEDRPQITPARGFGHVDLELKFQLPDPLFYEAITADYLTDQGESSIVVPANEQGEPIEPYTVFMYTNSGAAITSSPFTFDIEHAGDVETRHIIMRLESASAAGYTNPKLENLTTGQEWSSTTDAASTSDVLSVNAMAGLGRAQKSTDNGSTFVDDTIALSLGTFQAILMELAPGTNSMRFTSDGAVNVRLLIWWLNAYRD